MRPSAYIAAPYPLRDRAVRIMGLLESRGVTITSTWLKQGDTLADEFARLDLADVARADVLVAVNPAGWGDRGTGGRHVELGYALALGKPVLLVGERTNLFHHLAVITVVADALETDLASHVHRLARYTLHGAPLTAESAVTQLLAEFRYAAAKHQQMHSPHEGWAVIREEVDELWEDVKGDVGRSQAALREAIQVGAMALRYVTDLAPVVTVDDGAPQSSVPIDWSLSSGKRQVVATGVIEEPSA